MRYNLESANRNSGDWLPGIKKCKDRLRPCGNARCMDMALAAAELDKKGDYASQVFAGEKLAETVKFARECSRGYSKCPLGASAEHVVYTLFDLNTR